MDEGLSFTDLVYGVVIGSAFNQFTGLEVSTQNALLLICLFIILNDYLLYHYEVREIPHSGQRVVTLFWLDMLVLLAWYGMVLASARSMDAFLLAVSGFYTMTAVWETVFSDHRGGWEQIVTSDWLLVLILVSLAVLPLEGWTLTTAVAVIPILVLVTHWRSWQEVWQDERVHA